jgi:hypothetical protein
MAARQPAAALLVDHRPGGEILGQIRPGRVTGDTGWLLSVVRGLRFAASPQLLRSCINGRTRFALTSNPSRRGIAVRRRCP